eukprot:PhM_4_TR18120/c0_g1_i1/m.93370
MSNTPLPLHTSSVDRSPGSSFGSTSTAATSSARTPTTAPPPSRQPTEYPQQQYRNVCWMGENAGHFVKVRVDTLSDETARSPLPTNRGNASPSSGSKRRGTA